MTSSSPSYHTQYLPMVCPWPATALDPCQQTDRAPPPRRVADSPKVATQPQRYVLLPRAPATRHTVEAGEQDAAQNRRDSPEVVNMTSQTLNDSPTGIGVALAELKPATIRRARQPPTPGRPPSSASPRSWVTCCARRGLRSPNPLACEESSPTVPAGLRRRLHCEVGWGMRTPDASAGRFAVGNDQTRQATYGWA